MAFLEVILGTIWLLWVPLGVIQSILEVIGSCRAPFQRSFRIQGLNFAGPGCKKGVPRDGPMFIPYAYNGVS